MKRACEDAPAAVPWLVLAVANYTSTSIQQQRNRNRKAAALVIALVDEDERQVQRSCWGSKFLNKEIISVRKKGSMYFAFSCLAISFDGQKPS